MDQFINTEFEFHDTDSEENSESDVYSEESFPDSDSEEDVGVVDDHSANMEPVVVGYQDGQMMDVSNPPDNAVGEFDKGSGKEEGKTEETSVPETSKDDEFPDTSSSSEEDIAENNSGNLKTCVDQTSSVESTHVKGCLGQMSEALEHPDENVVEKIANNGVPGVEIVESDPESFPDSDSDDEVDSISVNMKTTYQPEVESLQIDQPEVESLQIDQPEVESLQIDQPEVESLQIDQPEVESLQIDQPEVESLQIDPPDVESLHIDQPQPEDGIDNKAQAEIESVVTEQTTEVSKNDEGNFIDEPGNAGNQMESGAPHGPWKCFDWNVNAGVENRVFMTKVKLNTKNLDGRLNFLVELWKKLVSDEEEIKKQKEEKGEKWNEDDKGQILVFVNHQFEKPEMFNHIEKYLKGRGVGYFLIMDGVTKRRAQMAKDFSDGISKLMIMEDAGRTREGPKEEKLLLEQHQVHNVRYLVNLDLDNVLNFDKRAQLVKESLKSRVDVFTFCPDDDSNILEIFERYYNNKRGNVGAEERDRGARRSRSRSPRRRGGRGRHSGGNRGGENRRGGGRGGGRGGVRS